MEVFGLLGNPVEHSLSPPMHEAAYEATGLDARYVTFEPARGEFAAAVAGAASLGVRGLNVTLPFKEDALSVAEPDDLAGRVGAANTLDLSRTPPVATNTDVAGVRRAFAHHNVPLADRRAVVVGAGGAGRAAAVALADAGASVHVANRTEGRAGDVADLVDGTAGGLAGLPGELAAADVLVHATTVGMEADASPVPADALHGDLAVLDAVYTPLRTRLLRDADARGATTIDGGWMLLHQGAAAFERWTDLDAPVDAMRTALRERL